jgi:hypothetical protein
MFYLKRTSSTKYAYAKLSKCNTKYSAIEKGWYFYWNKVMLRVDYGKNMNPVWNYLLAEIIKIPRSTSQILELMLVNQEMV